MLYVAPLGQDARDVNQTETTMLYVPALGQNARDANKTDREHNALRACSYTITTRQPHLRIFMQKKSKSYWIKRTYYKKSTGGNSEH